MHATVAAQLGFASVHAFYLKLATTTSQLGRGDLGAEGYGDSVGVTGGGGF